MRELNPEAQILARTSYIRDQDPLRQAGADVVLSGESEVALIHEILGRCDRDFPRSRVAVVFQRVNAKLLVHVFPPVMARRYVWGEYCC